DSQCPSAGRRTVCRPGRRSSLAALDWPALRAGQRSPRRPRRPPRAPDAWKTSLAVSPSWGNGLWWVCIGADTNPRVSRPRAGAVRRPPGGASRALPQASQILGTEKPIECRGSARHRARELEQARGALAELEERAVGRGEERADQPPQIGLMADDRHRTARLLTREPAESAIDTGARRQLGDALHSYLAVRGGDDLRGVDGPLEGAGGQEVQRGNELF